MREIEALLKAAQLDSSVAQHLIILVQMKVLGGKCGYQAARAVISPSSHLQTHTRLVFTTVWTLVPGQRKRLPGQSYPLLPPANTHTFSVYNGLNFSATGQWNRHLCATLSSRSLQLEMLTAQNSLHPEIVKWSSGRRLFFWLTNAYIWSISPAASVAPSHPSLWSHCALGVHFETVF